MILSSFILNISLALTFIATEAQAVKSYVPRSGDPVLESWRWHVYPELKGKGLRCLAEASDGAMWFGTNRGVWRYDGLEWTEYTPADGLYSAPVNALYGAPDGSVYAGSEMGISRFADGVWRRVFPLAGDMAWPISRFTADSDGSLWVATAWGALHLLGEEVVCYTSTAMGKALAVLAPDLNCVSIADRVLPAEAWDEGLGIKVVKGAYIGVALGDAPMVIWAVASGSPAAEAGLQVGDQILMLDGSLPDNPSFGLSGIAGKTVELQVQRLGESTPRAMALESRLLTGEINDFAVSDILLDAAGGVWFGLSWRGQVLHWNRSSDTWRAFGVEDGLAAGGRNTQLAQTADGSVWKVSGDDYPLHQWDGQRWLAHELATPGNNGAYNINTSVLVTGDGTLWVGCHGGHLARWWDGEWKFTRPWEVPVPQVRLTNLLLAADGAIWFAGLGQEAVRLEYDTGRWTSYEDLHLYAETSDGEQWFSNQYQNLIHFDGEKWRKYEQADGIMDRAETILVTRDDEVWVGGSHNGHAAIARIDTAAPGGTSWTLEEFPWLGGRINATCVFEAADGDIWFGSSDVGLKQLGGFIRFNGDGWQHYSGAETSLYPYAIDQMADGTIWIGGGLHRFVDERWEVVDGPSELKGWIHDIVATRRLGLWVGTRAYGALRFDGQTWTRYGVEHGLADTYIESILEAEDGSLWVGTRKGISRFDGQTWVKHILPPEVRTLHGAGLRLARDGALWIWWPNLSIRYRSDTEPPETRINFFFDEVSQPGNNTVTWQGNDPWGVTPTAALYFSWRLDGGPWSPYTLELSEILIGLAPGEHVFEVKARDQDFNEDPTPAVARFVVSQPVWRQAWFLGLLGILGLAILTSSTYALRKRQDLRRAELALMREMEAELQTAHDLQMDLMPTEAPNIEGLDIASSCLPASQVGGDFYQYYHHDGMLKLCLADVAGHAMGAAIPVVMFSGVLESEIKNGKGLEDLYADLNRTLFKTLDQLTFVCFAMAEVQLTTLRVRVANSGCPYPLHYRAAIRSVVELEIDAYPLGLQLESKHQTMEAQLAVGDYLVFCSDGIIETFNQAEELFGFERTADVVHAAGLQGVSAEVLRDRLLEAVRVFAGEVGQEDDITCMVLHITG